MIQKNNHLYITIFLITLLVPVVFAEELELDDETIKHLNNVLQVDFNVKLIQPGEISIWNTKKVKYTIPGYTVILKMEGTNIKFKGHFTPYLKKENLLLIAQGQVWLSDPAKKSLTYFTFVKSISLSFGEKVIFLPLGIAETYEKGKTYNIEIEIQISPYSPKEEETGNQ
ncbi:MAG: hypothetical protein JXB88_13915 [Spirochaetales bacterium]|nr:hypothetical protein [Spirochaetales bacterium]